MALFDFKKKRKSPAKVFADAGKARVLKNTIRRRRPLNRKFPLCIEAISITCGGDLVHQLRPFVKQLHFYHPEWPLHIATDLAGYETINDLIRIKDEVWLIKAGDHKKYGTTKQPNHGNRWSSGWIGIKLENFRRAIEKFKCGVLQCDSDFVFTRALERINWQADVVLSTHHGPFVNHDVPEFHGYYNAGLLLSDKPYIADKWIELYQSGYGGFYEQKLLEYFSERYVTDLFPAAWNWGTWRHSEDISFNGRMPAILHVHINGPHRQDGHLSELGDKRMLMNEASYKTHNKIAFYHCSKAAGTTMMRLLIDLTEDRLQYQILNSFSQTRLTDWDEKELRQICHGTFKYQVGNRFIVHNHGQGWTPKAIDEYLDNDWLMFALYRPIRDRLCSFYTWAIDLLQRDGKHPMSGAITSTMTMDEFMIMLCTDPYYVKEWELPAQHDKFHWYPANTNGMYKCLKEIFNSKVPQEELKMNISKNPGWGYFVDSGIIKPSTVNLINNLPMVRAWDKFIADREKR